MGKIKEYVKVDITPGKHITVRNRLVNSVFSLHRHKFFELEIILSGNGMCRINNIEYKIPKFNMFFLTTMDFHYLDFEEETNLIHIAFDETLIDEKDIFSLMYQKKAYMLTEEEHKRIVEAAKLLDYECSIDSDCQRDVLKYILKMILRNNEKSIKNSTSLERYSGIKKALIYMQLHFKENITLKSISNESGYNPSYFSQLFKEITGETYIQKLNKLRVGYARTLLENGFSVSDACFLSGFGSLSNFFTIFKRECQMSPSKYRNDYSKKN